MRLDDLLDADPPAGERWPRWGTWGAATFLIVVTVAVLSCAGVILPDRLDRATPAPLQCPPSTGADTP